MFALGGLVCLPLTIFFALFFQKNLPNEGFSNTAERSSSNVLIYPDIEAVTFL